MGCAAALAIGTAAQAQTSASSEPAGYEFGRGLRLGDSGLTLGGYATLEYRRQQGAASQLKISHADAFVWWEGLQRVKVFAELDVLDPPSGGHDGSEPHDQDNAAGRRVSLERLHVDYTFNDAASLRLGKFLTPIGRWNPMHADPLVWTTTAPLITQTLFPRNVTGASLTGNLPLFDRALTYWLYASDGHEWRADRAEDPFAKVRGARVVLPLGSDWQLGLSFANYQTYSRGTEPQQLRGVDLFWSRRRWELSAEWLHTAGSAITGGEIRPDTDDKSPSVPTSGATPVSKDARNQMQSTRGGFLQGVAPLAGEWYAVGRIDWLRDPRTLTTLRQEAIGLVWRPHIGTTLKLEALRPHENSMLAPRSVVASVSVLF